MSTLIVILPLLFLLGLVLPLRRKRLLSLSDLLSRIPEHRFRGLETYLEDDGTPNAEFWRTSGGIWGLIERFQQMTILVRILQIEIRNGEVSREDAAYVWRQAWGQVWFSLWAVPESLIARWAHINHLCCLCALRCYWYLSVRTVVLCDNRHMSATAMPTLL
jgi:hypothetical protein